MNPQKVFRAKAPVRVDFTGGYTDISPFTDHFTGKSVNGAIKLFTYVDGFLREDKKISIFSEDIGTRIEAESLYKLKMDGQLDIVKAILLEFSVPDGVGIRIKSEAPLGSGLGTSASLGVATAGLINTLTNSKRSRLEIAELAAYVERKVGIAGGRQDQYASAMGGMHLLEFSGNHSNVLKINLRKEKIEWLEKHLLLIHPRGTRNSGCLVEQIMKDYQEDKKNVKTHLIHLNELAPFIYDSLLAADIKKLSSQIGKVRLHQCHLHKDITNQKIDNIFSKLARLGITDGKQLGGAGSGACLIFICDPIRKEQAKKVLKKIGCHQLPLIFDMEGLNVSEGNSCPHPL